MKKALCFMFGHKYRKRWSYSFMKKWDRIICTRCRYEWVMNHENQSMLPWDQELDDCGTGNFMNNLTEEVLSTRV